MPRGCCSWIKGYAVSGLDMRFLGGNSKILLQRWLHILFQENRVPWIRPITFAVELPGDTMVAEVVTLGEVWVQFGVACLIEEKRVFEATFMNNAVSGSVEPGYGFSRLPRFQPMMKLDA